MWSRDYNVCVSCGTANFKHVAKGLCSSCYMKRYNSNPMHIPRIKQQKYEWYLKQPKENAKIKREKDHFDGMREPVLERDNRKCTQCNETRESKLVVHHIDGNGRGSSKPNNDMSNLTTLCKKCHLLVHKPEIDKFKFKKGERWSRYHNFCIECGTTSIQHGGRGLCANCYARFLRGRKPKPFRFEWSLKFAECQICRTTSSPHEAFGLCHKCYQVKANKDIVRPRKKLRENWRQRPI